MNKDMDFKEFVGIDVSKQTLDVTIYRREGKNKSFHRQFKNSPTDFANLQNWALSKLKVLDQTVFCMEHTGVYSADIAVFMEEKGLMYCLVSPLHIKRSLGLTRGKNDKVDSFQISRFAYTHRDELKLTKQPSANLKSLRNLLKERERLVRMQVSEKLVLSELMKNSEPSSIARSETRLSNLQIDISEIEKEMKQVIALSGSLMRNYKLMESVVGISLINSVYFLVYTLDFTAFTDSRKFACYSGVAPFEHSSGTSIRGKTRVSHLANKKIKACLSNGARSAVQHDPELRLYYKRKEQEGKEHGVIMNAVKFKLITRVFATVKRESPYVKIRQAG